jgi:HK97 gp10 family phage protein
MPIQVRGIEELSTMLTEVSARTAKRYLVNVSTAAGQVMVDELKATAPVESGRLETGVGMQTRYENANNTTLIVSIGPAWETFWGAIQEFGTQHIPALHWVARAFESCKDKVLSVFVTEATATLMDMENKK